MAVIKNSEQIEKLRKSAALLTECLKILKATAAPGKSGLDLDNLAEEFIRDHNAIPAFKGYGPGNLPSFPGSICFSRNHVLVHGVPSAQDIIEEGDLVTIDCGLELNGWFADAARLFIVGEGNKKDFDLVDATKKALAAGVNACKVGARLGDVCNTIQKSIALSGYYNVIQFCGHGIGQQMHELPRIPNFGKPGTGMRLKTGMVFCLEPMLRTSDAGLGILPDRWTVVTLDQSRASHIEDMVLVTDENPEILTEFK